jgi:hypothetical protein
MKKFLFAILVLSVIGCSKDSDPISNNNVIIPTSDAYTYFIGKIDGKPVTYEAFVSADTKFIGTFGTSATLIVPLVSQNINYSAGITSMSIDNEESIKIEFINFMTGVDGVTTSTPEEEFFDELFKTGNYNFVSTGSDNKDKLGVGVTYVNDEQTYSTDGSQPSSSSFKILSVSNAQFKEGRYGHKSIIITGIYSCRLFNDSDVTKYIDMKDMTFKIEVVSRYSLI